MCASNMGDLCENLNENANCCCQDHVVVVFNCSKQRAMEYCAFCKLQTCLTFGLMKYTLLNFTSENCLHLSCNKINQGI